MTDKSLYLVAQIDVDAFRSRWGWIHAQVRWAHSPSGAFYDGMGDCWLLHSKIFRAVRPGPISKHFERFLVPSLNQIDLFIYEAEIEDIHWRVGSGKTAFAAALCLPAYAHDQLQQAVREFGRDPGYLTRAWCIQFPVAPFAFPPTRRVRRGRSIPDCWVKKISEPQIEVALVERTSTDSGDKKHILFSFKLQSSGAAS